MWTCRGQTMDVEGASAVEQKREYGAACSRFDRPMSITPRLSIHPSDVHPPVSASSWPSVHSAGSSASSGVSSATVGSGASAAGPAPPDFFFFFAMLGTATPAGDRDRCAGSAGGGGNDEVVTCRLVRFRKPISWACRQRHPCIVHIAFHFVTPYPKSRSLAFGWAKRWTPALYDCMLTKTTMGVV